MNSTVQQVAAQRTHVHSTVGKQCNERTCAAAMQHKDFQTKDLRSQCNMGDDAYVELVTEEATSWQADEQKQTPLNFVTLQKLGSVAVV